MAPSLWPAWARGVWGSLEEAASIIKVETETLPHPREPEGLSGTPTRSTASSTAALKPVYDKGAALAL